MVDDDFYEVSRGDEFAEKFLKQTHEIVKALLKSDVLPFSRMQRLIDVTVLAYPTPERRNFKVSSIRLPQSDPC